MVGGNLKVETIALFRKYGEIHRDVFLEEEIVGVSGGLGFIGGHGSTREELDAILRSCIERGKALRAPTGRKRGRPRGSNGRIRQAMSRSHLSESSSVARVASIHRGGMRMSSRAIGPSMVGSAQFAWCSATFRRIGRHSSNKFSCSSSVRIAPSSRPFEAA